MRYEDQQGTNKKQIHICNEQIWLNNMHIYLQTIYIETREACTPPTLHILLTRETAHCLVPIIVHLPFKITCQNSFPSCWNIGYFDVLEFIDNFHYFCILIFAKSLNVWLALLIMTSHLSS